MINKFEDCHLCRFNGEEVCNWCEYGESFEDREETEGLDFNEDERK